jgi:hypothetical protein
MTREIDPSEQAEALDDTDRCSQAIAKVFRDLRTWEDPAKALELAEAFLPRMVAAQRQYEIALIDIYDDLVRQVRTTQ